MASSPKRNHAFIYDKKIARSSNYHKSYAACNNSHAMFASSSTFVHGRSRPRRNNVVSHVPRKMCNEPTTVFHACNTSFVLSCKNAKVVARKLGSKCKGDKTCIWVPKTILTNLIGPNKSWVPKTQDKIALQVYASGGSSWIIDSGCTNHMTGEKKMFTSYVKNKDSQDVIIFGDGNQGKVKGLGKIAITSEHSISNVFLVESLGYNLLSVSKLCNMGYNCLFTNIDVSVFRRSDGSLAFNGVLDGKLYLVDFSKENADLGACLIAKTNMGWLWHRRLAHVGMKNLHKLLKGDHVLGLTDVYFEKDRPCAACQAGKQVGSTHHSKNVMTTSRPLELLHMDLFGPVAYLSIGGSKYGLVIVDDFSRYTWVFFLQDKLETQGTLKRFLRMAQNEFELKVKKVRSNNGSEFKNLQVE
jgi:hypothetical protein